MKTLLKLSFLLLILSAVSCTDDNTTDPNTDSRDKFLGAWKCKETIGGSATTFTIEISKSGVEDTILIKNFSNYGSTAIATGFVSGSSLTIPSQDIGVTNIPVQGSGVYSDAGGTEKINMNYTTDGNSATAICTRN